MMERPVVLAGGLVWCSPVSVVKPMTVTRVGLELSNEGQLISGAAKRSRGFSCPVPGLPRNKV